MALNFPLRNQKPKLSPEQTEKRLTMERDASRLLARQLEWRLVALEQTLTPDQQVHLCMCTC
jgi:hypothetical protein